jgi:hypothetical protein
MAFDKPHEKNFYQGENWAQIHKILSEMCFTYVATDVITCVPDHPQPTNLEYLKRLNTDEKFETTPKSSV